MASNTSRCGGVPAHAVQLGVAALAGVAAGAAAALWLRAPAAPQPAASDASAAVEPATAQAGSVSTASDAASTSSGAAPPTGRQPRASPLALDEQHDDTDDGASPAPSRPQRVVLSSPVGGRGTLGTDSARTRAMRARFLSHVSADSEALDGDEDTDDDGGLASPPRVRRTLTLPASPISSPVRSSRGPGDSFRLRQGSASTPDGAAEDADDASSAGDDDGEAYQDTKAPEHPIFTIVLTGGPCAGKTTAMARLADYLRGRHFRVYTVPEAATMLFTNGATFGDLGTEDKELHFQENLLKTQMHLEDTFYNLATDVGKPAVLLCDRGTMDGSAYIPKEVWSKLMVRCGFDEVKLRDRRYDAVIHMTTAADGALQYYTLANNEARTETPEQAIALDRRLQQAWVGHSQPFTIDNSTSFEGKLRRVVSCVARLVGLPDSKRSYRKFLLKSWPKASEMTFPHESFNVNKVYLKVTPKPDVRELIRTGSGGAGAGDAGAELAPDGAHHPPRNTPYAYVRRRRQVGSDGSLGVSSFGFTSVTWGHDGQKVELKRIITQREYKVAVQQQADPSRRIVRQTRTTFLWQGRYYELWLFRRPCEGLAILACQDDSTHAKGARPEVVVPPGFVVNREVAGDAKYSAYHLSLRSTGLLHREQST